MSILICNCLPLCSRWAPWPQQAHSLPRMLPLVPQALTSPAGVSPCLRAQSCALVTSFFTYGSPSRLASSLCKAHSAQDADVLQKQLC